jgi:hypothetical protein
MIIEKIRTAEIETYEKDKIETTENHPHASVKIHAAGHKPELPAVLMRIERPDK